MRFPARFELPDRGVVFSPEALRAAAEFLAEDSQRERAEVLFTGWGSPRLDEDLLCGAPKLRAVFHAAGSVRDLVSPELWARGIVVCSAWRINAQPVAEFALAEIILALKHAPFRSRRMHAERRKPDGFVSPGAAGSVVGLVGLGAIGRRVRELLRALDVHVLAHDPVVGVEEAERLGVESVGLDDLFRRSDAVSLHLPALEATRGLVGEAVLRSMKTGATLINTSRGSVIDEKTLVDVLTERDDLFALLDVTDPDPPAPDSPLYCLPNVWLTPHIAGSVGRECLRMGDAMVAEARRFFRGEPLRHQLTRREAEAMT